MSQSHERQEEPVQVTAAEQHDLQVQSVSSPRFSAR